MKLKIAFVIILSLFSIGSFAQMYYMPDSMFRQKLTQLGYGTCITGDSIDGSCSGVMNATTLKVDSSVIHNLAGIEAFANLINFDCSSNYLTSLPVLPNKIRYLDCSDNWNIGSITILPDSLKDLNCTYCGLHGFPIPTGLVNLYCSSNNISYIGTLPNTMKRLESRGNVIDFSIQSFPNSLEYLDLYVNHGPVNIIMHLPDSLQTLIITGANIDSIPTLPINLKVLSCDGNNLNSLPALPATLRNLMCAGNLITTLPTLPATLDTLNCGNTLMTGLPALPNSLTYLSCDNSQITVLPTLPVGLKSLSCNSNLISSLPLLPNTLLKLYLKNNLISTIASIPIQLQDLDVSKNYFNSLPNLPPTLKILSCSYNPLDSLPILPDSLLQLYCSYTNITSLQLLGDTIYDLLLDHNPLLSSIPRLPSFINYFRCGSTPNLHCLPRIGKIGWFAIDSTGIQCLSGYDQIVTWTPILFRLPDCDLNNINGCPFVYNIQGQIYLDADSNCTMDSSELKIANVPVQVYKNGQFIEQVTSSVNGEFHFFADSGSYTYFIDTVAMPFSVLCPQGGIYSDTITATDTVSLGNNFGVKCNPNQSDVSAWSIVPTRIRPGSSTTIHTGAGLYMTAFGINCIQGLSGTVDISWTGNLHFTGPAAGGMNPSTINSNSIQYTISDFGNLNGNLDFTILTDSSVGVGTTVCFNLVVHANGDTIPANDSLTLCFPVVGSFDPNDKSVYPDGYIGTNVNELIYTIRFQNTGTDTAYNIHVIDTLDDNIDPTSVELLAASHPCNFHLYSSNVMEFSFPDINLPDSFVNEPLSHGYIQYKVKLKSSLPLGRKIENRAHIYFDYNPAIITNSTSNEVALHTDITNYNSGAEQISVVPNPFTNQLVIDYIKSEGEKNYVIFDVLGNEILRGSFTSDHTEINTSQIGKGIYFLRIENHLNYTVQKILKL